MACELLFFAQLYTILGIIFPFISHYIPIIFILYHYLVGGLEHVLFSIIYGMSSFPLTSFFSRWLKPPTSNYCHRFNYPLMVVMCIYIYNGDD